MTRGTRVRGILALSLAAGGLLAGATPARAQTSWGLAALPSGDLVFCDRLRSTVWRIAADGGQSPVLTGVSCFALTEINGEVFGESTPSDVTATRGVGLWKLDRSGQRQWLIEPTLAPPSSQWIVRDADGRSIVWTGTGDGHRGSALITVDALGVAQPIAGGNDWAIRDGYGPTAAFANIEGYALAPDHSLLVLDTGQLRRISPLGLVTTEALAVATDSRVGLIHTPGLWAREIGVAADLNSEAVIVDPAQGRIVHVSREGRWQVLWAPANSVQRATGGRWGWRPSGVAMTTSGYYVVDEWNGPAVIADLVGSPRVSFVDTTGRVQRVAAIVDWWTRAGVALAALIFAMLIVSVVRRRQTVPKPPPPRPRRTLRPLP